MKAFGPLWTMLLELSKCFLISARKSISSKNKNEQPAKDLVLASCLEIHKLLQCFPVVAFAMGLDARFVMVERKHEDYLADLGQYVKPAVASGSCLARSLCRAPRCCS
eukprot:m.663388 g.663388  ORF g.663388 m.663388 type:complete len:108 (+) comp58486_c0_seq14:1156-1479(+)